MQVLFTAIQFRRQPVNRQDIATACEHLRQGQVIAYPTEAVWGLGCDPDNRQAVERILAIKQRAVEKGLILVAADTTQLGPIPHNLTSSQRELIEQTWPGPVTWLIPDPGAHYPDWIRGGHDSVAIRVSAHPLVRELCFLFGKPIVSTSANIAGEPAIRTRAKLKQQFGDRLDYIVDGELGSAAQPSEIRDLATGKIIRRRTL